MNWLLMAGCVVSFAAMVYFGHYGTAALVAVAGAMLMRGDRT